MLVDEQMSGKGRICFMHKNIILPFKNIMLNQELDTKNSYVFSVGFKGEVNLRVVVSLWRYCLWSRAYGQR